MNIALLFHASFASSLQGIRHWWASHQTATPWTPPLSVHAGTGSTQKLATRCATPMRGDTNKFALRRPVRVVRVLEAGQPRSSVGRMVISGRMADVCAELDRLAEREAALS